MSKITSIATGNPPYAHAQETLCNFADAVYSKDAVDSRKLKFLYRHSGIERRYSVLPDFSAAAADRNFFMGSQQQEPFPNLEQRMQLYTSSALDLSVKTIEACIEGQITAAEITHLVTVSCTGMSAPGLDLQVMEAMQLSPTLQRTSVNFMGCYAALHGLKLAHAFCCAYPQAKVVVVCTELCTLHFQKEISENNILASLLFSDGCAAMLVQNSSVQKGFNLQHFFSQVAFSGKNDMAWELSGKGFLMTLTGYVPDLVKADFEKLVTNALLPAGKTQKDITHWCVHPGGRKILQVIEESMKLQNGELQYSHDVLRDYGNMSSPSIVFVLQKILQELQAANAATAQVFGAAFGPGLTMETFLATYD